MSRGGRGVLLALCLATAPRAARPTGFTDYGNDILASPEPRYGLSGALRLRSEIFANLDLDRGPTPSGEVFFPVSMSEPGRQVLYAGDLRLRTDLSVYAPGGMVAVKARIDVLDNLALGSGADGLTGDSRTQRPPGAAFRIKRAYGELVTPVGYLAAGRVGAHWGLGLLVNGGDCADCDSGDAADRVAFITPLVGHLVALAYDFSATGHLVRRRDEARVVDVEPAAAVRSWSVAILRHNTPAAHRRRNDAGRATWDYGATYAHRRQARDIPASYLPLAAPATVNAGQVVDRGFAAEVVDCYLSLDFGVGRIAVEAAMLLASVRQTSLTPGLGIGAEARARQRGAVFESDFGLAARVIGVGLDAGVASGDPAPGFGAQDGLSQLAFGKPGDLNGPQADMRTDRRIDNFRFHPDYRVDRILFREIIGTVTDAAYVRPHAQVRLLRLRGAELVASVAAIASWAVDVGSTPGGARALGVEIDPTLGYQTEDGLQAAFEYAVLFPFAGLDNPRLGLAAKAGQLFRLRLGFGF